MLFNELSNSGISRIRQRSGVYSIKVNVGKFLSQRVYGCLFPHVVFVYHVSIVICLSTAFKLIFHIDLVELVDYVIYGFPNVT